MDSLALFSPIVFPASYKFETVVYIESECRRFEVISTQGLKLHADAWHSTTKSQQSACLQFFGLLLCVIFLYFGYWSISNWNGCAALSGFWKAIICILIHWCLVSKNTKKIKKTDSVLPAILSKLCTEHLLPVPLPYKLVFYVLITANTTLIAKSKSVLQRDTYMVWISLIDNMDKECF